VLRLSQHHITGGVFYFIIFLINGAKYLDGKKLVSSWSFSESGQIFNFSLNGISLNGISLQGIPSVLKCYSMIM